MSKACPPHNMVQVNRFKQGDLIYTVYQCTKCAGTDTKTERS